MPRPDLREMRALPMLEPRRVQLEKCVFCPKLCRSACPVSNAEPRETITPWGKMSLAWMAAHGDVPIDASHAAPAWACTGCGACREACDHRNAVAHVLMDARDAFVRAGVAPAGAIRAIRTFDRHDARTRAAARKITASHARVRADAPHALLVGCGYLRAHPRVARDAIDAAVALTGARAEAVSLVDSCCGLPLRLAGDREGFARRARAIRDAVAGKASVIVVDSGCALALRRAYRDEGVDIAPPVELLVERAARSLSMLRRIKCNEPIRWHDPCHLGRGLGVYEAPRAVLTRILGRAPDEFEDRREHAHCSGAGGLLPSTMPEVAASIAHTRLSTHTRGRIVTGCAAGARALRADDIATWIARALRPATW